MKKQLFNQMEQSEATFAKMAKEIWDNPQIGYEETFAFELQKNFLAEQGFRITTGSGDIATAFVAEWGTGAPIIGFLGEFDALPGFSQRTTATLSPIVEGGPGHGCGHNLLGTAGVEAVVALKNTMEAEKIVGTIRYYGCPAEELLSGKSYMARAGVFDDLDIVYTWHPGTFNMVVHPSMQALTGVEFFFSGRTAHAAGAPHLGRSALDGVEIMNVGSNYLREHVPDGSRIHYQITNGGLAPNIVPDKASVYYFLRGATRDAVDDLLRRLIRVAEGAAHMTETTVRWEIRSGCYDSLPNMTLNNQMYAQWQEIPPIDFTEEEQAYAKALQQSIEPSVLAGANHQLAMMGVDVSQLFTKEPLNIPQLFRQSMPGSSDLGDVSWIAPLGQVTTVCAPHGVQVHTWQATSSFGTSIGMKGMHYAAKTMAGAALDSLLNPEIIVNARAEFDRLRAGKEYICAIPDNVMPPKSVPVKV
ncbi:amidohydrolase [Solibacillus sp. FSL R7-0668]|uniref:amidohydrolase n=1 Tax=Solibacillus sp. FSL R7-0668 TaxID=2921688 RepID=UPI0030F4FC4F